MSKVFIDVGGFEGDACRAALDPIFGFDRVIAFEPVQHCAEAIRKRIQDPRLEVVCAALADFEGDAPLFGPGTLAGSLFQDHSDTNRFASESCLVHRASHVIAPILEEGSKVYLKLNCEGAEIPIVEDLLGTGAFQRLESILLDLDARKIPSLFKRLQGVECALSALPRRNWHLPEDVEFGWQCTFGGIRNWLRVSGASLPTWKLRVASLRYNTALWRSREFRGYYKFLLVRHLPDALMRFYYHVLRARKGKSPPTKPA